MQSQFHHFITSFQYEAKQENKLTHNCVYFRLHVYRLQVISISNEKKWNKQKFKYLHLWYNLSLVYYKFAVFRSFFFYYPFCVLLILFDRFRHSFDGWYWIDLWLLLGCIYISNHSSCLVELIFAVCCLSNTHIRKLIKFKLIPATENAESTGLNKKKKKKKRNLENIRSHSSENQIFKNELRRFCYIIL